ncbi:MAG: type I methionyl aminopeptidase [Mycoplasma sp.]|nr:type I methionyl aminopeptidase [Mycoplasma sp.]
MNLIKTNTEIKFIKKSASILKKVKKIVRQAIKPGISLLQLDKLAYDSIIKLGGEPAFLNQYGFPNTACISLNEEVIHGIPNNRVLKIGDLIKVDLGVIYKEYYSDSAFTMAVGDVDETSKKIIKIAKSAFYAGLNSIKPGARVGDIEYAIGQEIKKNGFFTPKEFTGHGIGRRLHEEPIIRNDGQKNTGIYLEDNMVICIEPIIVQKSNQIFIKKDKWTVVAASKLNAAHYEHTVLIQKGKGIILT